MKEWMTKLMSHRMNEWKNECMIDSESMTTQVNAWIDF